MLMKFLLRLDFMAIPVVFYIVVLSAGMDLTALRSSGWLFDMGDSSDSKWYEFYSYYSESPFLRDTIVEYLIILR